MTTADRPADDALAAASARGAEWIRRAAPVRFGVATSAADVEAAFRLRYAVVVENGWAAAGAFPDGLERDADDDRALQVAAWHEGRVVATARLVLPVAGRPLPTETGFGLTFPDRARIVDVGRVCVALDHRDSTRRILRGLLGQIWREMNRLGRPDAVTALSAAVARLYERLGLSVTILGPARVHWGASRSPARISPAWSRLAPAAAERSDALVAGAAEHLAGRGSG